MKHILYLLAALFALNISSNAQEIRRNAFEPALPANIADLRTVKERIDPNFPTSVNSTNRSPQTSPYVRPDARKRTKRYLSSAFGLSALAGSGAGAAIGTITNSPKEWHGTTKGFVKRFASSYAQGAISRTATFVIDEAFKLDNHFEKSGQTNFGKRFKHVLKSSFATRTKTGKYVPDFPQFIGTYTGNIIARETWFPKHYTYKDGLKSGTIGIFTRFGVNLLREFFLK